MYDIPAMIKAVCDMVNSFFNFSSIKTETQLETDIVQTKKNYKKACDFAEKIIALTTCYKTLFSARDRRLFDKFVKKFNENE